MSSSTEHAPRTPESQSSSHELETAAQERLDQLRERTGETEDHAENRAEAARETIKHHEAQPEPAQAEHDEPRSSSSMLDRVFNYKHTLRSLQRQLPDGSRRFSRVIHAPAIERTSEILDQTIFRPSVSLGATSTAFIVGLFFYVSARHYGFRLSGSEILISLIVGAMLGLAIEGLVALFRRSH